MNTRSQASIIFQLTLVVTFSAFTVIMARLLFNAYLGTCAKAAYRRLAIHFIGTINAIVLAITAEYFRYAVLILALELIVSAFRQCSAYLIGFVFIVATIIDTITQSRLTNAFQIGALEGIGMTAYMGTGFETFITAIRAIIPTITFPSCHYTFAIRTSEMILRTNAIHFITAIGTIVIAITLILPARKCQNLVTSTAKPKQLK